MAPVEVAEHRESFIYHPRATRSNLLEARRRTRRAPIVALTDAGSPSPCIVHIDGRRRHHRLIPVAHRYPLGLKQSPGVKAHPRPRNPRLEAAPGGKELDREWGAVDSCRLAAFARNHHLRRSSKSPTDRVQPDPAPGPRGAERREMSFKRGLIKPENLCGTLTAVCIFAPERLIDKYPGGLMMGQ